jgi:hypothetical protein
MVLWISIGAVVAILLVIALVVDRRDRRGGAARLGRMRLPGRLTRYREARMGVLPIAYERTFYKAEREEPPQVD